jgi:DNA-binding GntR family transcriptional regulator
VKQQILERILKGRYSPGQRLREVALAKELNTSPIPVREALRELESLRIVESEAYKGVRVRQPTPKDLVEAYELRALLESYAAEKGGRSFKGNSRGTTSSSDGQQFRAGRRAGRLKRTSSKE